MIAKINHTQLSNDFIDNHMSKISGNAVKVFLVISRKTIGWHKDSDKISISQIISLAGLSNKTAIKAIKELETVGIILVKRSKENGRNYINEYEINYGSEETTQGVVEELHKGSVDNTPKGSVDITHTKESVKETLTKDKGTARSKKFIIPNVEQIKEYALEKNIVVDAEKFFYYYDSNGWMVGKNKMKNWHSALSGWASREKDYSNKKPGFVSTAQDLTNEDLTELFGEPEPDRGGLLLGKDS